MSLVTTLARAEAMATQSAQPIAAFRHRHLSERPLVLIPLMMAGEAAAPLGVMVGTSKRDGGRILTVPQPRNRDQRFGFAAELGRVVMEYIDSFRNERVEPAEGADADGEEAPGRFSNAPQILVPNRGGVMAVRHLGRMTRFRRVDGSSPVDAIVPETGFWFTVLAERAEYAGSSMLLAMTDLLSELWATGQSSLEDQNLASLIGWIDPPAGMTGLQAALEGEDPVIWPPAGPATDPEFDNKVLGPAIEAFDAAVDEGARAKAEARLKAVITTQLQPTWNMMWQGLALARAVPEAPRAQSRWDRDCYVFTARSDYLAEGGRPQPKRDFPVSAARRLSELEAAQTFFDRERALDDPFALADLRCTGEAFGGTVVEVEADREVVSAKNRRTLRPRFTVETADPLKIPAGTKLISPDFPAGHRTVLVETHVDADGTTVVVEITGGMGTPNKPIADAVPELGRELTFLPDAGFQRRPSFPAPEETPWTHGGPPSDAGPSDLEDADEQWGSQ